MEPIVIETDFNPYRDKSEGRVNQLAPAVSLLTRACDRLGVQFEIPTQRDVFDRLMINAPRVAIVSGSPDHIGHIMDEMTVYRAAIAVWQEGGVPFHFGIPVVCDATAQAHIAMSYSLFTRNLCAEMVASQMEGHNYHAAIMLQGCDKTPLGSACGLVALDRTRRRRGEAPVWTTFIPIHVLGGAAIPGATQAALDELVARAERAGASEAAEDLRVAAACVLQCATNASCGSVFQRLTAMGVMSQTESDTLTRQLASSACEDTGGMCAFHGTGNSSRIATASLGLAHPAGAFLTEPPSAERVSRIVADLFKMFNRPDYSVLSMVRENWENAVRVHSATGGSSNLVLHLVALANYAGMKVTVETYDRVRRAVPVPDIFDYSLSEFRTHYELAKQCESGQIRGIDTILYELTRYNVPLNLDAPTVTATTWRERLRDKRNLPASGVQSNPIVLSRPRRPFSGVDLLKGNFFDSAVVKISGMTDNQLAEFDDKLMFVYYFENEDDAIESLLDPAILDTIFRRSRLTKRALLTMLEYNAPDLLEQKGLTSLPSKELYDAMVTSGALKIVMIVAGQGPRAFGMPEMCIPMNHINCNRRLRKVTTLVSDGRYSGVSYGAAIGHLTPEAADKGDVLYLKNSDVLRLRLRARLLDLMDPEAFSRGKVKVFKGILARRRKNLGIRRLKKIAQRRTHIVAHCMQDVTDASTGVIPRRLLEA